MNRGRASVHGTAETDGRVLRGARNHEAIVRAVYELVRESGAMPTIDDVAARAGVGVRTVFRQFQDTESLFRSMSERLLPEILALARLEPPSGDLDGDVRTLVARRARIFEHIAPFRRAGAHLRARSPFLREQDALMSQAMRARLEATLGPHLGADGADDLEAIDALLSFETWEGLRIRRELGVRRAERVLVRAVSKLVGGEGRASRRRRAPR